VSLPQLAATRYVQPLREGGSLPAVVDTAGGGLYVVKFRGAGQGAKVLVAELIVAGIALRLGLSVPAPAIVDVSPRFGRSEPDPEIQDLLRRSHGENVGLRYLDGAFNFDASAAGDLISAEVAARIVWLDAFTTNPDRTARNPNLLIWDRQPWLIDHGAALYVHYDWSSADDERTRTSFPLIRSHVLLSRSADLVAADEAAANALRGDAIREILADVPDSLLVDPATGADDFRSAAEARTRYQRYLTVRLRPPRAFLREALAAQDQLRREPPLHLKARR
jgi:hypothetical protein